MRRMLCAMNSEDLPQTHIPAAVLWNYSRKSAELIDADLEHLKACDHCIAVLGLCRVSNSIKHLEKRLKDEKIG